MAISIYWPTSVINIPRNDMTLIQSVPNEIRELDLNTFRNILKSLEAEFGGMGFPVTHIHNPPFDVGTIELARAVKILDPYTITFEDGQYAVNIVGGNTNLADRTNVNQVSVRPSNSAGLATSSAIEYGEYGGGVTIDTGNVTGNAASGSVYPTGTLRKPCVDISDALIIANSRGFSKLFILGEATFTSAHDIDGFQVYGQSHVQNVVTLEAGASVSNTVFKELEVIGELDGNNELTNCVLGDLTYFSGHIHSSGLKGTITLSGGSASVLSRCMTVDPLSPPSVDMGGSGQDLAMPNYSGLVQIHNLNNVANMAGIGLSGGQVVLDSSDILAGTIYVSGSGELLDENGDYIPTGTWNTNVTVINTAVSADYNADRVWNYER